MASPASIPRGRPHGHAHSCSLLGSKGLGPTSLGSPVKKEYHFREIKAFSTNEGVAGVLFLSQERLIKELGTLCEANSFQNKLTTILTIKTFAGKQAMGKDT